jgi:nitrous oxidase accessory protein
MFATFEGGMRRALSIVAVIAACCGVADASHGSQWAVTQEGPGLQAVLDAAEPGDVVELHEGIHAGPARIDKPLILRGHGGVIDGGGQGSALVVSAPGARVEGVVIRNSGEDVGASDACIYVDPSATGAVLRDNTLTRCAFGIWVHETDGVQIIDNRIESREELRTNDRGNGIHLFNASNLVVRGNEVSIARDGIYVSATEDSLIQDNVTSNVRFGIHYMYSYRNTVSGNVANDNTVGFALMESRYLIVEDNRAFRNRRNGLLFRDVESSQIRRNHLEGNGNGMFFFSSVDNVIEANRIIDNEMGLKIWAGTKRNRVEGNVIRGNREQVFYVAAEDQIWGEERPGNYWSDYIGWDQDGDGVGDRPHRVDSFTTSLLHRYPSATLLLRSPALEILAHMAERLPMFRTPTVVDRAPLMVEPLPVEPSRAEPNP